MTEKKNSEKKGLRILLLIVLTYALIVTGVVFYVKLDKDGLFKDENTTLGSVIADEVLSIDTPLVSEDAQEVISTEEQGIEETNQQPIEDNIAPIEEKKIAVPSIEIVEEKEDLNQDIELIDTDYTIADVPARPRPERPVDKETTDDEVLNATDLVLEVAKPKSFLEKVFYSLSNLFSSEEKEDKKVKEPVSPDSEQVEEELNSEIEELKAKFTFVTESNGTTWIDHVDKPTSNSQNGFYIYMGMNPQGFVYNRIVLQYSGKEWIDLTSILLQTDLSDRASIIDAKEFHQRKEFVDLKVKNEWVDLPPTTENNALLQTIAKASTLKLTFMGDIKNVEWTVSEQDLSTLKESIYFYELLKQKNK